MDQIIAPLLNAGGMGVALAVLVWLVHNQTKSFRAAAKAFREELAAEREQCHKDHQDIMMELQTTREAFASAIRELVGCPQGSHCPLSPRRAP